MNSEVTLIDRLLPIFATPGRSVLEWVDELCVAALRCDLALDWQAGCCGLTLVVEGSTERREYPMRKSVFRAILARVAAVGNEQAPNATSPYGGHGQFKAPGDPSSQIEFSFTNTPDVQRLSLTPRPVNGGNSRERIRSAASA